MIRLILFYCISVILLGSCAVDVVPNESGGYIKFVGSSRDEIIKAIEPTSDGGFILVGSTTSFRGADKQDENFYIAKVDMNGNKQWDLNWGGDENKADGANAVMEMPDGSFWVLGYTTDTLDLKNMIMLDISSSGEMRTTTWMGDVSVNDQGKYITKMSDGNYLVLGETWVKEQNLPISTADIVGIKMNSNKDTLRQYRLGKNETDDLLVGTVQQDQSLLWFGDLKRRFSGSQLPNRIRVAFTNLLGSTSDDYIFGDKENSPHNEEAGQMIYLESSNTYVAVGTSGDISGTNKDVYLLKFALATANDAMDEASIFSKKLEKQGDESAKGIYATSDGGFIIVGTRTIRSEDTDIYLLKTDAEGNEQWSKTFGGAGLDEGIAVRQTPDGGYLIFANVWFKNNKVAGLYKTDSQGVIFK